MKSFEWTVVSTDIGPLLVAATEQGLVSVVFHADAGIRDRALGQLAGRLGAEPVEDATGRLKEPVRQLTEYFAGGLREFTLPLDWSLSGGFNREVLRELAAGVPFGTVVGYGDLASRVGQPGAAQAVGAAMGSNPLPVVVPCHRVVETDGKLGASAAVWRRSGSCWPWRGFCRSRCSEAGGSGRAPRGSWFRTAVRAARLRQ